MYCGVRGSSPERAPDLADAHLQRAVADVDVRPGQIEQLVLRHELPAPRHEVLQDRERLRRQRKPRRHGEAARPKVQTEGTKSAGGHWLYPGYHCLDRTGSFVSRSGVGCRRQVAGSATARSPVRDLIRARAGLDAAATPALRPTRAPRPKADLNPEPHTEQRTASARQNRLSSAFPRCSSS